jgi:hypothetical protein
LGGGGWGGVGGGGGGGWGGLGGAGLGCLDVVERCHLTLQRQHWAEKVFAKCSPARCAVVLQDVPLVLVLQAPVSCVVARLLSHRSWQLLVQGKLRTPQLGARQWMQYSQVWCAATQWRCQNCLLLI